MWIRPSGVTMSRAVALFALVWLLAPERADAVGVAFCYLRHGKAGDETEFITTVKWALMERATRTEAQQAARAEVERTLEAEYSHLVEQSVYEHGEEIRGPYCDTWAFSSGYWTLIETRFANSSYTFHSIAAGVGTTEDAALANALKNLALYNWSWSRKWHGYDGLDAGGAAEGDGELSIGEVSPP